MHAEFSAQAEVWGGWVFGDLAVAMCRAVEILGPSANVVALTVRQPDQGPALVTVHVVDLDEVARLRHEAANGEYLATFVGLGTELAWEAEIHGIRLLVAVARASGEGS